MNKGLFDTFGGIWRSFAAPFAKMTPAQFIANLALSLLVIVLAFVIVGVLRRALHLLIARLGRHEEGKARPGALTLWVLRALVYGGAVAALFVVWGIDLDTMLSGAIGAVVAFLLHAGIILLLAVLAIEALGLIISQVFGRAAAHATDPRRAAQLRTLQPLLSGATKISIVIFAAMMILSQAGVNIAPLLAGAGVAGIAIGFGAQSLVKDFLTGAFLIVEDIVSVGDIVRIQDSLGAVETMTLRTVRLRDVDGTLHVYPYGEAQVIHNMTKQFAYAVLDVQISYSSDIDQAIDVIRAVGAEMSKDEGANGRLLGDIEMMGVQELGDSGVTIRARFKTIGGEQWGVTRDYRRRIKIAFDKAGIEIPFPHLTIIGPDNGRGAPAPSK